MGEAVSSSFWEPQFGQYFITDISSDYVCLCIHLPFTAHAFESSDNLAHYVFTEDYMCARTTNKNMELASIQNIIFDVLIGMILGFFITRYYYEKSKNNTIGKTIEGIMISKSVEEISSLSKDLNSLVEKIQIESYELLEQISHARDIETIPYDNNIIKNSENMEITFDDDLPNVEKNNDGKEDIEKE